MFSKSFRLFSVTILLVACLTGSAFAFTDYFPLFMGLYQTTREWDPGFGYRFYSAGISSTMVVNGTTCYVGANPDGDAPEMGYTALAKVGGAVMIYEVYDPDWGVLTFDPPQMYMPADPVAGSPWTYTDPEPGGELVTATVLATDETVTTPAGTFLNCLKVERRQQSGTYQYHWYAQDIGEVKFYDAGGSVKETQELVSFIQGPSCDTTPPATPVFIDDGTDTYGNSLHGVWTATDPESGIVEYKVAISTTPSEAGIIPEIGWGSVGGMTEFTTPGIPFLIDGETYYGLVKARNGAGLWSAIGVSDSITVHLSPMGDSPFPLHSDNLWQYQIQNAESGSRAGHLGVTGSAQVAGQTRFVIRQDLFYYGRTAEGTSAWVGGDLLMYAYDGQNAATPLIFLKAPLTTGLAWSCEDFDGDMTYFEVLADDETMSTPAGLFTGCAKVRQTWDGYPCGQDIFWFKPGVGEVQADSYDDCDWVNVSEHRELSGWRVVTSPDDITPPTTPVVTDDGSDSYGNIIHVSWTCADAESPIVEYEVAVSSTPNESGILSHASWRNNGVATQWFSQNLYDLAEGTPYYVLVKARNSADLWSGVGVSDGVFVHHKLPGESVFPLHVGDFWRCGAQELVAGINTRFVARVTDAAEIDGALAFTISDLRGECESIVGGHRPDGWYIYEVGGEPLVPPWHQLTYPLYEGQSSTRDGSTVTVEELHDTVSVPAGTFSECVRLRLDGLNGGMAKSWLAPGVGTAREDVYQGGVLVRVQELAGYYLLASEPVGAVKLKSDGDPVEISDAVVSAAWPDCFYLEAEDRSTGIRVEKSGHGLSEGKMAHVAGIMGTNADGERFIGASAAVEAGSGSVKPLGMTNRLLGGSDFHYSPGPPQCGQQGTAGSYGLNNIGLLTRVWGQVTASGTDPRAGIAWFYVNDGSNVQDGTGVTGVYCEAEIGVTPAPVGSFVSVTGVSGCEFYMGDLVNVLRVRHQEDIGVISFLSGAASQTALSQAGLRPRDAASLE